MCVCAICATPALAEGPGVSSPQPFADFTFKRVGLPTPGAGSRINVQIAPAAGQAVQQVAAATLPALPTLSGFEWFWGEVSPARAEAGPANFARALYVLQNNDASPAPRLQHLQDIAAAHGTDILLATIGTNISPALVVAVISVESAGDTAALSPAGAHGLMQLIPATAERFGVEDSANSADNIRGGVAYLAWLMAHFDQDPILALAGYNAGEGAVRNHDGVPPYNETRAYVPKVLSAWQVARGLCQTRPELITDGCVFTVKGNPSNG